MPNTSKPQVFVLAVGCSPYGATGVDLEVVLYHGDHDTVPLTRDLLASPSRFSCADREDSRGTSTPLPGGKLLPYLGTYIPVLSDMKTKEVSEPMLF